jgi:blue copper oxidase
MSSVSRRQLLKMFGVGTAGAMSMPLISRAQTSGGFLNPLQIPPLDNGSLIQEEGGLRRRHFDLTLQKGQTRFVLDTDTPTLGINGSYLGPTLRYRRGDSLDIQVHNRIGEESVLHWHGLHVPPRFDGGPMQSIADGGSWHAVFDARQPAATLWYHSHAMHKTGPQVYHGLAGMMILDDDVSDNMDLPSRYGVDDIPLILQDRRFNRDGSFDYMSRYGDMMIGQHGDVMMANGTVSPFFEATTDKIRLRILNGSNARLFNLAFNDGREFLQIASDGGLLEKPVPLRRLMVTPGERVELLVDVSDGNPVIMRSEPSENHFPVFPGAFSELMRAMHGESFDIMEIRPQNGLERLPPVPGLLTTLPTVSADKGIRTRRMRLNMGFGSRSGSGQGPGRGNRTGQGGGYGGGHFSINGRVMTMSYINERVKLGDTEIWEVINDTPMVHPFHIHGSQFRVLDRNGVPPPAQETGYKDTVHLHGRETVRLLVSFTDFADDMHTYMYHCHTLEHEDRGMMGQFLVTENG